MYASCIICTIAGILTTQWCSSIHAYDFFVKNTTFYACSNAQANTYITVTLFRRLEEKKSEGEQFDQKQK